MYKNYAEIRDKLGLTDYEVSKRGGFSRSVLTSWKNGKSTPSTKIRFKIAEVLGVPLDVITIQIRDKNTWEKFDEMREKQALRIASYAIKLADGGVIQLTPEQYEALQKAIDNFINVWVDAHNLKPNK